MRKVIVTRHPAAVDFIASRLGGHVQDNKIVLGGGEEIPIIASAFADDVRDAEVYGNLPLHLAALTTSVTAIEFDGASPRGQEYTLADMLAAGARLARYNVIRAN